MAALQAELHQLRAEQAQLRDEISHYKDVFSRKDDTSRDDVFEKGLPPVFRRHYSRFKLDQVDGLTKNQMSRLIKQFMLLILITDLDHLPMVSSKIGRYLHITSRFLDSLHDSLYDKTPTKPSSYLYNHNFDTVDDLERCLDQMLLRLSQPEHVIPRS